VYSALVLKQEYKTLQMGVFWVGLGTVMFFIGMYLLCLILKYEDQEISELTARTKNGK